MKLVVGDVQAVNILLRVFQLSTNAFVVWSFCHFLFSFNTAEL